jgi:hypothetical protein
MIRLITYFTKIQIRIWAIAFPALLGLLVLAEKWGESEFAGMLQAIPLLGIVLGGLTFQRNWSWIRGLPIGKAQLFLTALVVNTINAALGFATFAALISRMAHKSGFSAPSAPEEGLFLGISSSSVLLGIALLIVNFFVFLGSLTFQKSQWSPSGATITGKAITRTYRTIMLRFLAVGIVFSLMKVSAFLFWLGLLLFGFYTGFEAVSQGLALYPETRRLVLRVGGLILCLQGGGVYLLASSEVQSKAAKSAFEASKLLGSLSPTIPAEYLVSALMETKDEQRVSEILEEKSAVLEAIDLDTWLRGRSEPKFLRTLEKSIVKAGQPPRVWRALLKHFDSIGYLSNDETLIRSSRDGFTSNDGFELIQEAGPNLYSLGALLCARFLNPDCAPGLKRRILAETDTTPGGMMTIKSSLHAIGVLRGVWTSYDFFAAVKAGKINVESAESSAVDCSGFLSRTIKGPIPAERAGPLNHCMRRYALDHGLASRTKSEGWYYANDIEKNYDSYFPADSGL